MYSAHPVSRPSGSFAAQIGFLPICRTHHFDCVGSTPTLLGLGENHMAERVGCTRHILCLALRAASLHKSASCRFVEPIILIAWVRLPPFWGWVKTIWRRGWDVLGTSCASPFGQLRCTNRLPADLSNPSF